MIEQSGGAKRQTLKLGDDKPRRVLTLIRIDSLRWKARKRESGSVITMTKS